MAKKRLQLKRWFLPPFEHNEEWFYKNVNTIKNSRQAWWKSSLKFSVATVALQRDSSINVTPLKWLFLSS